MTRLPGRAGLVKMLRSLLKDLADRSHVVGPEIARRGPVHRDLLWALEGAIAELELGETLMTQIDTKEARAQKVIRCAYADALLQQRMNEGGRIALSVEEIADKTGESMDYVDAVLGAVFYDAVDIAMRDDFDDPR